ncbi:MAG: hypothetical protein J5772_00150 [Clostridia bacterium]|nr:hypothetical protein [Clostridia bacterium]
MNNDGVIKSIGDIDPEFIKEARPDSRRRLWARVVPAAALALILLIGIFTLPKILWPREGEYTAGLQPTAEPVGAEYGGQDSTPELGSVPGSTYGGDVDYCLRRVTLEEMIAASDLVVHAECTAVGEARKYTFRVMDSYPVSLPESIVLMIPSYHGTSLEGLEYSPKEGDRSILFFVNTPDGEGGTRYTYNGVIRVLDDGTLKNDSISDLADYTYDGLVKALPELAEKLIKTPEN